MHSPSPLADPTPTQNEKGGGRFLKAFQNRQKKLCFLLFVSSCMKGSEGKSDCVGQTEQKGRNTDGKEEVVGNSPTEPGFTCDGEADTTQWPSAVEMDKASAWEREKGKKASSPRSSSSFRKRLLLRPPQRPEEEVGKGGRKRAAAVQKRKTTKKGGHKREKEKRKKGSSSFLLLPAPDIRKGRGGGGREKEASFLHSFFRKGRGNGSLALIPLQWEKEFPPAVA